MIWTTDKPTVPSRYWYRENQKASGVLMRVEGMGEQTSAVTPDGRWESVSNMDGEWSARDEDLCQTSYKGHDIKSSPVSVDLPGQ